MAPTSLHKEMLWLSLATKTITGADLELQEVHLEGCIYHLSSTSDQVLGHPTSYVTQHSKLLFLKLSVTVSCPRAFV